MDRPACDIVSMLKDPGCLWQAEAGGQSGSWQRWEQVKLLRAEWSRPKTVPALFSRVLYISNLKPVRAPDFSSNVPVLRHAWLHPFGPGCWTDNFATKATTKNGRKGASWFREWTHVRA